MNGECSVRTKPVRRTMSDRYVTNRGTLAALSSQISANVIGTCLSTDEDKRTGSSRNYDLCTDSPLAPPKAGVKRLRSAAPVCFQT